MLNTNKIKSQSFNLKTEFFYLDTKYNNPEKSQFYHSSDYYNNQFSILTLYL
jgi:hypothetical protein